MSKADPFHWWTKEEVATTPYLERLSYYLDRLRAWGCPDSIIEAEREILYDQATELP